MDDLNKKEDDLLDDEIEEDQKESNEESEDEKNTKTIDLTDMNEDEVEERLDNLIKDIRKSLGMKDGENRPSKEQIRKIKLKNLLYLVIEIIVSFASLFALTGLFDWLSYINILNLLIVFSCMILIETVISKIFKKLFLKYYILSLGLISLVPLIISFLLLSLFGKYLNVIVINYGLMILVILLYFIVKLIAMIMIKGERVKIIRS